MTKLDILRKHGCEFYFNGTLKASVAVIEAAMEEYGEQCVTECKAKFSENEEQMKEMKP